MTLPRPPRDAPAWGRSFLMESELLEKALEASGHASSSQQEVACAGKTLLEKALDANVRNSLPKSAPAKITSISFSDGSQFVRTGEFNPSQVSNTECVSRKKAAGSRRIPCLKSPCLNVPRNRHINGETHNIFS
eukprot:207635-Prorocentrum_minimum.AAC.3